MKVILIKIYGGEDEEAPAEEDEMVHVSAVSGTPLGLREMTVISQIDLWRDRALYTTLFTQLSDTPAAV